MKVKESKIDFKSHDLSYGMVVETDDGRLLLEEYDKDGFKIDEHDIFEIFDEYIGKKYIKLKIEYKYEENVR